MSESLQEALTEVYVNASPGDIVAIHHAECQSGQLADDACPCHPVWIERRDGEGLQRFIYRVRQEIGH